MIQNIFAGLRGFFREKPLTACFQVLCVMMYSILLYYSLGVTGVNSGENWIWDEHIYFVRNSVLGNLLLLAAAVLVSELSGWLYRKIFSKLPRNLLLGGACLISLGISLYWMWEVDPEPIADQSLICQYAAAFNQGDFAGFGKGIYVARYPQQLGMITILRIFWYLFGEMNWKSFWYFSALMIPLMLLAGCQIVRRLSNQNREAEWHYLVLMICCVPMYCYTTFVYGELCSTAFAMVSVWAMLACLEKFSWARAAACGLSLGLAVQMRENVIIVAIAMGIVLAVKLLDRFRVQILFLLISVVLGVALLFGAVWLPYADKLDPEAEAIPASLFIVMGLMDDYNRPGWHTNYEWIWFGRLDDDVEKANQKAREDFQAIRYKWQTEPGYMVDFFVRKLNSQWQAPMYQGLVMNREFDGVVSKPISSMYNRKRFGLQVEKAMKGYQMLVYGSVLVLTVLKCRRWPLERSVLLVAVFGGFLFSLMWEAKTRYVFPYLLMMLPYAAVGIHEVVTGLGGWFRRCQEQ